MASITDLHTTPQTFQLRPERIVLQIEDNPADSEVVAQVLAHRSDLRLQTATDGPLGIEMACLLLPDVILLDLRMPGMGGLEVFSILRQNPTTAHIPVIVLSSNAYQSEIKKCLDAGTFRYLTKPYKIHSLIDLIDAAICYASDKTSSETTQKFEFGGRALAECSSSMQPTPLGEVDRIHL